MNVQYKKTGEWKGMEKSKYNLIINNKIINTKTGSEIMLTDEYLKAFEICDLTFLIQKNQKFFYKMDFLLIQGLMKNQKF